MEKIYYASGIPTLPLEGWVDRLLKAMAAGVPVIDLGGGDRAFALSNATPLKANSHE